MASSITQPTGTQVTHRQKHYTIWGFTGIALIVVVAVLAMRRPSEIPIRAQKVTRQNLINSISTNGKVEPLDNFEAHAPVATTVRRILVKEGDHVRKNQLLLELDASEAEAQAAKALSLLKAAEAQHSELKAGGTQEEILTNESQLEKARAERNSAQRNYAALQRLQQTGAASPAEVQEAKNRLERAQADVSLLEQKKTSRYSPPEAARTQAQLEEARATYAAAQDVLRKSIVRAPNDGTVYSIPVRPSEFVNQGELLLQSGNLEQVQVRAFVDEPEIGKLAVGQSVTVRWDALPNRMWTGNIIRIPTTVITRGTRNVGEVICSIENNQDPKLLPNVNVTVTVTTAHAENVLTVPREAVHVEEGKHFVYVVANGRLHHQDVAVSVANLTRIEVTSGLEENTVVALGAVNAQGLREGMRVHIVP